MLGSWVQACVRGEHCPTLITASSPPSPPTHARAEYGLAPWVSPDAAALLQRMLEPDAGARATIDEIWSSPWVRRWRLIAVCGTWIRVLRHEDELHWDRWQLRLLAPSAKAVSCPC